MLLPRQALARLGQGLGSALQHQGWPLDEEGGVPPPETPFGTPFHRRPGNGVAASEASNDSDDTDREVAAQEGEELEEVKEDEGEGHHQKSRWKPHPQQQPQQQQQRLPSRKRGLLRFAADEGKEAECEGDCEGTATLAAEVSAAVPTTTTKMSRNTTSFMLKGGVCLRPLPKGVWEPRPLEERISEGRRLRLAYANEQDNGSSMGVAMSPSGMPPREEALPQERLVDEKGRGRH